MLFNNPIEVLCRAFLTTPARGTRSCPERKRAYSLVSPSFLPRAPRSSILFLLTIVRARGTAAAAGTALFARADREKERSRDGKDEYGGDDHGSEIILQPSHRLQRPRKEKDEQTDDPRDDPRDRPLEIESEGDRLERGVERAVKESVKRADDCVNRRLKPERHPFRKEHDRSPEKSPYIQIGNPPDAERVCRPGDEHEAVKRV